ncbi:chemotaxis protein CheA [Plastorhodobacter daqingensis]|uniref:Chemotaxis protein CheA n=1 Tax=Plastorhodobacter daqingensis TaxID=1387281 RepID=A0ABW2UKZ2_9RHOB
MSGNDIREGFFEECEDLLEAVSDGFGAMGRGQRDKETLNAVFRAVHSIKGGAGAFNLDTLVEFAHKFESVLDAVRSEKLTVDDDVLRLFHRAGDRLADLVVMARNGQECDPAENAALVAELAALIGNDDGAADEAAAAAFVPVTFALDMFGAPPDEPEGPNVFVIRFSPHRGLYATGNEPALLFQALGRLGTLTVEADLHRVPQLSNLVWDEPVIDWILHLETTEPEMAVREVFDFVEGLCDLEINAEKGNKVPDFPSPLIEAPPDADLLKKEPAHVVELAPAQTAAAPSVAPSPAAAAASAPVQQRPTIRVDLERVDRLINLVGELVINQAMLTQSISEVKLPQGNRVEVSLDQLKRLSSEVQERIMAIRAQPVKPLFQRMARIAREAGQAAGKNVHFSTIGDATEVDKTVIERLGDPLTHMIRNAVDHGLEPPEIRLANGKPEQGNVILTAAHRSGRVIIELSDDGAGINRPRVREVAISKGLIPADKELTDNEIDNLLFLPGFSTKAEVSNLSGRGVGMDVVKSEIQNLGGRVSISSRPGFGTTVTISLPLTLAVLEGMVVEANGETLILPTTALQETVQADPANIHRIGTDGIFLSIRGGYIPILDLGVCLGLQERPSDLKGRVLLLLENSAGSRTALAVDRVVDQREVVIKGLEGNYGHIPGIAAATILGDGRIALILDTDELASGLKSEAEAVPHRLAVAGG